MFATPASLLYRLRRTDEVAAWGRCVGTIRGDDSSTCTRLLYHWAHKPGEQESDSADLVQDVFVFLQSIAGASGIGTGTRKEKFG